MKKRSERNVKFVAVKQADCIWIEVIVLLGGEGEKKQPVHQRNKISIKYSPNAFSIRICNRSETQPEVLISPCPGIQTEV